MVSRTETKMEIRACGYLSEVDTPFTALLQGVYLGRGQVP